VRFNGFQYITPTTGRSIQKSYDKGNKGYYSEIYGSVTINGELISVDSI